MFNNSNFAEARDGRVKIDDFSADVVQKLMDYVYTGRMGNMEEEEAFNLLAAGHKYCIEGVQVSCLNCDGFNLLKLVWTAFGMLAAM
jgi:hypothetical protein